MQSIENLEGKMLNTIEVINCNHGGFYSVNDWSRDAGSHGFGHMLGQVQRVSAGVWLARRHGEYCSAGAQFSTRRDAVAFLAA